MTNIDSQEIYCHYKDSMQCIQNFDINWSSLAKSYRNAKNMTLKWTMKNYISIFK